MTEHEIVITQVHSTGIESASATAAHRERLGQAAQAARAKSVFESHRAEKSPNTLKAQARDLELFAEYLSELGDAATRESLMSSPQAWVGLKSALVHAFALWLERRCYSHASINRALATVKVYAKLASDAGAIKPGEAALIKQVSYSKKRAESARAKDEFERRGEKKVEPNVLTDHQIGLLLSLPDESPKGRRDRLIITLSLEFGLRVSEIVGITLGNVNLPGGILRVYRPKVSKWAKYKLVEHDADGKVVREAKSFALLKAWLDCKLGDAGSDEPLFVSITRGGKILKRGMSTNAVAAIIRSRGQEIGIDNLSPHDLRHTTATTIASKTGDPIAVQSMLGHASINTSMRYIKAQEHSNERVLSALLL